MRVPNIDFQRFYMVLSGFENVLGGFQGRRFGGLGQPVATSWLSPLRTSPVYEIYFYCILGGLEAGLAWVPGCPEAWRLRVLLA